MHDNTKQQNVFHFTTHDTVNLGETIHCIIIIIIMSPASGNQ